MFEGHSFLYVEDDMLSRQVMQMIMFNAMGVTDLILFEDSADFTQRVQALAKAPDIILLDVHITPLDGFDLLKLLRRMPQHQSTRIIALTASVMNEEVEQMRAAGFDGAISKPLSVTTFPALLERIVRGESVWHIQ